MNIDDPRLVWMPEVEVLNQTGFVHMLRDRWFIVHPETGNLLFFQSLSKRKGQLRGASPQCNSSETTAQHIQKQMYPWAKIKFFTVVACPIFLEDYA